MGLILVNGQGRRISRVPRWYRIGVRWGLLLIGSSERGRREDSDERIWIDSISVSHIS